MDEDVPKAEPLLERRDRGHGVEETPTREPRERLPRASRLEHETLRVRQERRPILEQLLAREAENARSAAPAAVREEMLDGLDDEWVGPVEVVDHEQQGRARRCAEPPECRRDLVRPHADE